MKNLIHLKINMKKIKLIYKEKVWDLEKIESQYLYSYLIRFGFKNNIDFFEKESIDIPNELLKDFKLIFQNALRDLLTDSYVEPSLNIRQKHSTRFEKFIFNNKKYVVNYVHSIPGRLMYLLYLRKEMIQDVIDNNYSLKIITSIKEDISGKE